MMQVKAPVFRPVAGREEQIMSKLNKTTVYDVAKGLATWIAENANGGLTLRPVSTHRRPEW